MISKKQKLYNLPKKTNISNIIQTSNNITYVSINYDSDQQKDIQKQQLDKQKFQNTSTREEHHTSNALPYCPPPDYNTSSDESQDKYEGVKRISSAKKHAKTVEIQRTRNAGGSLELQRRPVAHNNSLNTANNVYHLQSRNNPYYSNQEQQYASVESYLPSHYSDEKQQQQQKLRRYNNSHQSFGLATSQPSNSNVHYYSHSSSGPKYYPGDTYSGINSSRYDNKISHLPIHHSTQYKNVNDSRRYYDYPAEKNDSKNRWNESGLPSTNYYPLSNQVNNPSQQHYSNTTSQHNRTLSRPITMPIQSQHHHQKQSFVSSSPYHNNSSSQSPNSNTTIIRRF